MTHYAKIENGIVTEVIVAEEEFFDTFVDTSPGEWLQTSQGGLRKNFAGIGFIYDRVRDAFIETRPYPSSILNEYTCQWEAPIAYPTDDKRYTWDEDTINWVEIINQEEV